ncbi:MAG TPA: hypothetical protein VGS58_00185 [Candidatus Sulfopaludibacter sp.]|nr:hypothetical protein [Candidatus Sulfopaludibacter sp.]
MRPQMKVMMRIAAACLVLCGSSLAAEPPRQQPQLRTTDHADLAPGGTIRIDRSRGCLSVEAWDQPGVEVTVTRYRNGFHRDAKKDRTDRKLQALKVTVEKRSDKEVVVTTTGSSWGMALEYRIRAPRDSHIAIRHGKGSVIIDGVEGGIEATAKQGDIVAMLPDPGPYAIDARTRLGTIYADYGDPNHQWYLTGERLEKPQSAARRVYLRTAIGGIEIQAIPASARPGD